MRCYSHKTLSTLSHFQRRCCYTSSSARKSSQTEHQHSKHLNILHDVRQHAPHLHELPTGTDLYTQVPHWTCEHLLRC